LVGRIDGGFHRLRRNQRGRRVSSLTDLQAVAAGLLIWRPAKFRRIYADRLSVSRVCGQFAILRLSFDDIRPGPRRVRPPGPSEQQDQHYSALPTHAVIYLRSGLQKAAPTPPLREFNRV
jgi:hypothetical protein